MKQLHLAILGGVGLCLGVVGGLAATGMLTPYLRQHLPGTASPASPELKSEPRNLPQSDETAYLAFDQGRYLTALELAGEAANRNDPQAHTLIGRIYGDGLGVPKDEATAARWYARAAELGDTPGMLALGTMLAEGRGVAKDMTLAAEMFEKAAATGDPLANYNLGLLFLRGNGKPENPHRAAQHIKVCGRKRHRRRAVRSRRPLSRRPRRPQRCARSRALELQGGRPGPARRRIRLRRHAAARPRPLQRGRQSHPVPDVLGQQGSCRRPEPAGYTFTSKASAWRRTRSKPPNGA